MQYYHLNNHRKQINYIVNMENYLKLLEKLKINKKKINKKKKQGN